MKRRFSRAFNLAVLLSSSLFIASCGVETTPVDPVVLEIISFVDVSLAEGDGSATLTLELSRAVVAGETVTFDYATSDGTATEGIDYNATSGASRIAEGESTASIEVLIIEDSDIEGNETINVKLSRLVGFTGNVDLIATITIEDDEIVTVTLKVNLFRDVSLIEGDEVATLTVRLNRAVVAGETVTFDYATSDGTATAGDDYTATNGTKTIAEGESRVIIEVPILEDTTVELNETIVVTLTPTGFTPGSAGSAGGADLIAIIIIIDDESDPAPLEIASFTDVSYTEATGNVTLSVVLNRDVVVRDGNITFDYATSDGTARSADYTATSGTETIVEGESRVIIEVPITDDNISEGDETIIVTLTPSGFIAGSVGGVGSTDTDLIATITIVDDEAVPPALELFSFDDVSYIEGTAVGSVTLNVILSRNVVVRDGDVSFEYTTSDGNAETGDYTTTSGTKTIAVGANSATIEVAITNDGDKESDETINVTLSSLSGFTAGNTERIAIITIIDDDSLRMISFDDVSYSEGIAGGVATLTVVLNRVVIATDGIVSFNYATGGGTATVDDFFSISGKVTFVVGANSATIEVSITNDSDKEPDETINVALNRFVGFEEGSVDRTATITIIDDEGEPKLLSFANVSYPEGIAGGIATLTVELNRAVVAVDGIVRFGYATGGGTAAELYDYTATSGTLTFGVGASTASIEVPIVDDYVLEIDETINVTLSNLVGFEAGNVDLTATITIANDDAVALVLASFRDLSSYTEGTTGYTATLNVVLNRAVLATDGSVRFDYATSNGTATVADNDYTATSGTVTFVEGASTASIEVNIIDDNVYEFNETINVTLSDLVGFTAGNTDLTATITIEDDETVPAAPVLASFANVSYTEGTAIGSVILTVGLNRAVLATDGSVRFGYATSDGTATVADNDYTITSVTGITFAVNTNTARITVPITDDNVYEGDEEFTVTLSNLNGFTAGNTVNTDLTATITIEDDESPPPAPVLASFGDVYYTEGTAIGSVTLTVELNRAVLATDGNITFDYATSDGTATVADNDYTTTLVTGITFGQGTSTASITVPILDDNAYEGDEEFTVTLSDLVGFTAGNTNLTATITIVDDESPPPDPELSSFADVEVYEVKTGTNVATLDVELNRVVAVGENVSFTYSTSDGTATAGSDYTAVTSGSVSIAEGSDTATITIAINSDDENSEGGETFDVTIVPTGFDATSNAGSDATATVTINDYDVNISNTDGDTFTDADDVDDDGDGLIEISSASEFGNIRYNLAGTSYDDEEDDSAGNEGSKKGCGDEDTITDCIGYEIEEDIDLSTITDLAPIGGIGAFSGIFEGNGNTLSGVSIINSTRWTGLFGNVSGTIKSLAVTGTEVISDYSSGTSTEPSYVGAVVGYLAPSGVLNSVSANVPVSTTAGSYHWVGGLVGDNKGAIGESFAEGSVTGGDGENNVGGLVGSSSNEIMDSYATGVVTGGSNVSRIGGLVGLASGGDIRSSYATGDITGNDSNDYLGGLVGEVKGSDIRSSYATGDITGNDGNDNIGGLVGRVSDAANIRNSFAHSPTSLSQIDGGAGSDYVGGLVGFITEAKVENCYAISSLQGGTGTDNVGGLIGGTFTGSTVSYSYAAAKINGNNGIFLDGSADNVGRLWGINLDATVASNYYLVTSDYGLINPSLADTVATISAAQGKEISSVSDFEAITAASSEDDFTGADNGFTELNWDLTDGNGKYPSLKSYKAENGAQVEGNLLCSQSTEHTQCSQN